MNPRYYTALRNYCTRYGIDWRFDTIQNPITLIWQVLKVVNQLTEDMIELKELMKTELQSIVNEMVEDGTLAEIINVELLSQKVDRSELNDITVSVKQYGAVGDGVTDDTLAIQTTLNNHDNVYLPKGTYITSKPLYFNRPGINLTGASVGNTSIKKITNDNLNLNYASEKGVVSDDYDAILMTLDYYGDFTIKNIKFTGNSVKNDYGLLFPHTYRFNIEDVYITDVNEGIRLFQGWNNNIKKTRIIRTDYGIRIESLDTVNPEQSTSINFDNTFVETSKVAYKFVNLTYFSGNSMSSDFITECAYWFWFTSGAINGLGNENSKGQVVRCWLSNITINGGFILGMKRNLGTLPDAKSNAKFEIFSQNRNATGLMINGFEIRSAESNTVAGDDIPYALIGGVALRLTNMRDAVMYSMTGVSYGGEQITAFDLFERFGSDGLGTYTGGSTRNLSHNDVIYSSTKQPGYEKNEKVSTLGYEKNHIAPEENATIVVPLDTVRKVYPHFCKVDDIINGRFKVSLYCNRRGFTDMYINGKVLSKDHVKQFATPTIDVNSITITETELIFNLNVPINYYTLRISRD